MPSNELEALRDLVASDGWAVFRAYVDSQWGADAYRLRARQITQNIKPGEQVDAANLMLQLESSTKAVEGLFDWLNDRLKKLGAQESRSAVAR